MSTPNRILDAGVTARLGRQNRVLRHLRTLGVPVLAAGLDDELTLVERQCRCLQSLGAVGIGHGNSVQSQHHNNPDR